MCWLLMVPESQITAAELSRHQAPHFSRFLFPPLPPRAHPLQRQETQAQAAASSQLKHYEATASHVETKGRTCENGGKEGTATLSPHLDLPKDLPQTVQLHEAALISLFKLV